MKSNFKIKPWRSEKYKKWIRTIDCVECGYPGTSGMIDAHHIETGGMATKCGDNLTVPLCNMNARGCHQKADKSQKSANRYLPIAERLFQVWSKK